MYTFPHLHALLAEHLEVGFPIVLRVQRLFSDKWIAWLEDADAEAPLTVLDRNGDEFLTVEAPTCHEALSALDTMCR